MGGSDCLCACATTFARYGSAALPGLGGSWRHHGPSRNLSTACSIGRSEGKVEDRSKFWRKKWSATSVREEEWQFDGRMFWKLKFLFHFPCNWPDTQSISQNLWAVSHVENSKLQVTLKSFFFHCNARSKSSDKESTLQHFTRQQTSLACETTS